VYYDYGDNLKAIEYRVTPMKKLAKKLKKSGVDTSKISLEQAAEFYIESKKLECKRLSMILT
jgi:hypothetical protein